MYENTRKFFFKSAQQRIKKRIEEINTNRLLLRQSGNIKYKHLKQLKPTHIYPNKPKLIKNILEDEINYTTDFFSPTIATAILKNVKLIPERLTTSNDPTSEKNMKIKNLEFLNLAELYWGRDEYLLSKEGQFLFFFNLFSDLLQSAEYSKKTEQYLIDYIPFASFSAYDYALKEDGQLEFITKSFYDRNIDVLAESIFYFQKCGKFHNLTSDFIKMIHEKYEYDSKDSKGRYKKKKVDSGFSMFDKIFDQFVKEKLLPSLEINTSFSLGKRVYDIITSDLLHTSEFFTRYITISPEAIYSHLTLGSEPEIYVSQNLNIANDKYVSELCNIQIEMYGDIEKEYYASPSFRIRENDKYFSKPRYDTFIREAEIEEAILYSETQTALMAEQLELEKRATLHSETNSINNSKNTL